MATENENAIFDLLDRIKVTDENRDSIEKIRNFLDEKRYQEALVELKRLQDKGNIEYIEYVVAVVRVMCALWMRHLLNLNTTSH